MAKTPHSQCKGPQVQFLVRELDPTGHTKDPSGHNKD